MATFELPGRGTEQAPANRFEELRFEPDPDVVPDPDEDTPPPIPTRLYRDASRSILAENSSPDVGFRFSVNPYRGCEHGCVYCLEPGTPVLYADMTWRPIGGVRAGDVLAGFDEHPSAGRQRKMRTSVVEHVIWSRRPTLRLATRQCDVVTTAEHRWLGGSDPRWSRTSELSRGRHLRHVPVTRSEPVDDDYRVGYVAGLTLGERNVRGGGDPTGSARDPATAAWRVALADDEPLRRLVSYLAPLGVDAAIRPFLSTRGERQALRKVEVRAPGKLEVMRRIVSLEVESRGWRRGLLAGFFDAGGAHGDALCLAHEDEGLLARVARHARALGFAFQLDALAGRGAVLRLAGSLVDRMRFFAICRPAIARRWRGLFDRDLDVEPEPIEAIERGPQRDVVDIQTSTRTFFAAGLATHNCYARPSHEYLGWNAGLDFETRLLVKTDAPELLRHKLATPHWQPQVIALSGNTDCYQPVERRLKVTRRVLEVLRDFRNPVGVITKSALVARDADLLGELAEHGAAHVRLSVTTLDTELARRMEPRAATPARRLLAIDRLAEAGVPVAVMIGPVIPGLNDAEIPRILEAAANAGAQSASWVLLRLASPLDELFTHWLARHYPEKRERVLNRIRATRAGRLNDSTFGARMRGDGEYAKQIALLFEASARRHRLADPLPPLRSDAFRRPPRLGDQLLLL
jgi:DNA repair photolyase